MQPFLDRTGHYQSEVWPEITVHYQGDHLRITSERMLTVCGNAVMGERGEIDHIVNWRVGKDFDCADPREAMIRQFDQWKYTHHTGAGLLTAANLHHMSIYEEATAAFRVVCCVTAGTGNSARAGAPRPVFEDYGTGTINIVLMLDARMTEGARINAIMTATEAKAAALQDLNIRDHLYPQLTATGTTSDAILLAVDSNSAFAHTHRYAGTVTPIGNAVGRLVYEAVSEAVSAQF